MRGCQADVSRKRGYSGNLDSPESPAMLFEMRIDAIRERVALVSRQESRKVAHHLRVGIERSEALAIGCQPGSQSKTRRSKFWERYVLPASIF